MTLEIAAVRQLIYFWETSLSVHSLVQHTNAPYGECAV